MKTLVLSLFLLFPCFAAENVETLKLELLAAKAKIAELQARLGATQSLYNGCVSALYSPANQLKELSVQSENKLNEAKKKLEPEKK